MKKIIVMLVLSFMLVGCGCTDNKAAQAVKDHLNQYKNLSDNVLADLDAEIESENLSADQKEVYSNILKKQYQDLKYEILSEDYDGDKATVTTKITVYDLYKTQKEASDYMSNHVKEFYDENDVYDNTKFIDYKLDKMKKTTNTTTYTIDFKVNKSEDNWTVEQPSQDDLEKIHGIYNYDEE